MTNKVYSNGVAHDAIPHVYKAGWRKVVPWVFSNGAWHRAYNLGDENLLSNSRMLNGTDVYCYIDGTVMGSVPPCYTIYNNSPSSGFNSYMTFFNQDNEYSRGYTIRAVNSRLFFQTRISVKAGEVYTASVFVKNEDVQLSHSGVLADIYVDADGNPNIDDYVTFSKRFDDNPDVGNERIQISSTFVAKQDCVLQFNYGVGIRYNTSGEFSFDSPQVTKTNIVIDYQPTPHVITNEAIIQDTNSGFKFRQNVLHDNSSQKVSGLIKISDGVHKVNIFTKEFNDMSIGMSIDLTNNMFVINNSLGAIITTPLKRPINTDKSIGVAVWFDISGGYITNVRLYINGEVYARILSPALSIDIGLDTLFGLNGGITVEQFDIFFNGKSYLFNIQNLGNNTLVSTDELLTVDIIGDFRWWSDYAPMITTQPNVVYEASVGDTVTISATAARFNTVEWRNSRGESLSNTESLDIQVVQDLDTNIFYYATYENEYGQVITRSTRISIV